uniref:Uncharacterized protein n=1 Tax=Anopheles albimanus TaxID=7167 RepID=A0A182FXG3_ANOAL
MLQRKLSCVSPSVRVYALYVRLWVCVFCVSSVSMLQRKNDPALPEVEQKEDNEGSRAIEGGRKREKGGELEKDTY